MSKNIKIIYRIQNLISLLRSSIGFFKNIFKHIAFTWSSSNMFLVNLFQQHIFVWLSNIYICINATFSIKEKLNIFFWKAMCYIKNSKLTIQITMAWIQDKNRYTINHKRRTTNAQNIFPYSHYYFILHDCFVKSWCWYSCS